jgi:glycosyltransferase involved in cell wall biosynthesis
MENGARVVSVSTRGYGAALYEGSSHARGRYIIMGDADDSYDFSNLQPFLDKLREGYDLVMGNRFRGGIAPGAMPWKNRYIGNPVLSGLGRLLFGSDIGDFHCGLRGYSRAAFENMKLRTTGMEFASEMVIKATLLRMRITEVPTTLKPDGRDRPPHLRPWRDGWRHLRFMLLYNSRVVFLYPGAALMLVGGALGAWLLPGPRYIGSVAFDVHTLLYAAIAVLIGFQGVAFAAFARVFAVTEGIAPDSPRLNRLSRWVSLELGLAVGFGLIVLGLVGSLWSLDVWKSVHFGPLTPTRTLRSVIPSVLALALGSEIVLSSFFLSMLRVQLRRDEAHEAA